MHGVLSYNMNIVLFHLPNSRSQRILWLLEELKCEYALTFPNALPSDQKIKYPTVDFTVNGITTRISETSAIAEFLYHHFKDHLDHITGLSHSANYFFWKNYPDGSFMPDLALKQIFKEIVLQTPWFVRFISKSIQYGFHRGYLEASLRSHMEKIESHLTARSWVDDDFGICDILLWFPLQACYVSSQKSDYPNIDEYLKKIAERPAFKAALKKGKFSENNFKTYWQ